MLWLKNALNWKLAKVSLEFTKANHKDPFATKQTTRPSVIVLFSNPWHTNCCHCYCLKLSTQTIEKENSFVAQFWILSKFMKKVANHSTIPTGNNILTLTFADDTVLASVPYTHLDLYNRQVYLSNPGGDGLAISLVWSESIRDSRHAALALHGSAL